VDKYSSSSGVGGLGGGVVNIVENVEETLSKKGIPTLFGEVFSTQPEDL
jgi:hypothetical protein